MLLRVMMIHHKMVLNPACDACISEADYDSCCACSTASDPCSAQACGISSAVSCNACFWIHFEHDIVYWPSNTRCPFRAVICWRLIRLVVHARHCYVQVWGMYKDEYLAVSLMHTLCLLTRCNSSQPFDLLSCILLPCYITDGATCTKYHTRHPHPQKHCHAVLDSINMHVIFKSQATATRDSPWPAC